MEATLEPAREILKVTPPEEENRLPGQWEQKRHGVHRKHNPVRLVGIIFQRICKVLLRNLGQCDIISALPLVVILLYKNINQHFSKIF